MLLVTRNLLHQGLSNTAGLIDPAVYSGLSGARFMSGLHSPGRAGTRSPRRSGGESQSRPLLDPVSSSSGPEKRYSTPPRQRPASPRTSAPTDGSRVISPRGSRNASIEALRAIESCRSVFEHELLRLMEEKARLERAILASQDRMNRELDALKKVGRLYHAMPYLTQSQSLDNGASRTLSEPKLRDLDIVRQVRRRDSLCVVFSE